MTIEEIRKGAPDGATHYRLLKIIERVLYFKKINGELFWFNDCDFWSSVRKDDGIIHEKNMKSLVKPL